MVILVNEDQSISMVNGLQQELKSRQLPPFDFVTLYDNP